MKRRDAIKATLATAASLLIPWRAKAESKSHETWTVLALGPRGLTWMCHIRESDLAESEFRRRVRENETDGTCVNAITTHGVRCYVGSPHNKGLAQWVILCMEVKD